MRWFLIFFSFVLLNSMVKKDMFLFMCEILDYVGILLFIIMGGSVFVELMDLLWVVNNMVGKLLLLLWEV